MKRSATITVKHSFSIYLQTTLVLICTLTFYFVQNHFTHTHRLWRNLYVLILLDILQSLFQ